MDSSDFWRRRVREGAALNPVDRIAEVLFGLIMVLSFTGTISVTTDGEQTIRQLLWAALGCNVAWGLVDAIMYLMNVVIERGHGLDVLKKIHKSEDIEVNRASMREEIQPVISGLLTDEEVDKINARLKKLPLPNKGNLFSWRDLLAGVEIFLLVFLCTLPVALPFAFLKEVPMAMRMSNGVALLLLFVGGYLLARYSGFRPVLTGVLYAAIGVLLVFITMALGG